MDISLGATNISSPPLGATASILNSVDTWSTTAIRSGSQLSDPWAGATASPPVDPWQPGTSLRSTPIANSQNIGLIGGGSVGGVGVGVGAIGGGGGGSSMIAAATNGSAPTDAWGLRTQSPSITSGSSTESWMPTNGLNGIFSNTNNFINNDENQI